MQTASFRIWVPVAVSTLYKKDHYATSASIMNMYKFQRVLSQYEVTDKYGIETIILNSPYQGWGSLDYL